MCTRAVLRRQRPGVQVAAEAGRLMQQLVDRRVRLLFKERLLTALGVIIAVNEAGSGAPGRQDRARGQQTSFAALTQVTVAPVHQLACLHCHRAASRHLAPLTQD